MPEIYSSLRTLRITGGEPLLDPNLFKVFDYIKTHPNEHLDFSINSNLGIESKIVDRMISNVNSIPTSNYKEFILVSSLDCWGDDVEYIRYGLNLDKFKDNLERVLDQIQGVSIRITATITLLSVNSLKDLFDYVIYLKNKYIENEIYITSYPIINPSFLALNNMDTSLKLTLYDAKIYMENLKDDLYSGKGFSDFELKTFDKIIENMEKSKDDHLIQKDRADFFYFIKEYDRRKKLNFLKTFPIHKNYLNLCEISAQEDTKNYYNLFENGSFVEKINSIKNLMRINNVSLKFFLHSKFIDCLNAETLDLFISKILSFSKDSPYFDNNIFNDDKNITKFTQKSLSDFLLNLNADDLFNDSDLRFKNNFLYEILSFFDELTIEAQNGLFCNLFVEDKDTLDILLSYFNNNSDMLKESDFRIFSNLINLFSGSILFRPDAIASLLDILLKKFNCYYHFSELKTVLGSSSKVDNIFITFL